MAICIETDTIIKQGNGKYVSIPVKWLRENNVKMVGLVVFDLAKKQERKDFFRLKERVLWGEEW